MAGTKGRVAPSMKDRRLSWERGRPARRRGPEVRRRKSATWPIGQDRPRSQGGCVTGAACAARRTHRSARVRFRCRSSELGAGARYSGAASRTPARTLGGSRPTLIEARWVIPVEPEGTVLEHHTVALDDGRIGAILPQAQARSAFSAHRTVALPGHVVLPGLVNAHTHAGMIQEAVLRR